MRRVSIDAEGVKLSGWRGRRWFYEDLAGARAEAATLWLARIDGVEERVRLDAEQASAAAAQLQRILSAPSIAERAVDLQTRARTWGAELGFATVPFVEWLLRSAVACGASDLHLSPTPDGAAISVRVDGVLCSVATLTPQRAARVVNRLKALSGVRLHRDDIPQEGRVDLGEGHVRVGFTPGLGGEAVTARLFDRLKGAASLTDLGFDAAARVTLGGWLRAPRGAILFVGPSASGKTTTVYTALRQRLAESAGTLRAVTVEDPVEYRLPDVVQLEADPSRGLTGVALLRAALRHDADVLMVGEVRDAESAALMIQAGMTGHLALATMHAGDAGEALERLVQFGLRPADIGGVVRGILAQRLVRLPCCSAGCDACAQTGYRGRTAVAELLSVADVAHAIGAGRSAVRAAAALGSLADAARLVTDAAEVERVFGPGVEA